MYCISNEMNVVLYHYCILRTLTNLSEIYMIKKFSGHLLRFVNNSILLDYVQDYTIIIINIFFSVQLFSPLGIIRIINKKKKINKRKY